MANNTKDAAKRRLSKADRRRQLLEVALAIIREEGTDRLTLGYLASKAGISKPIAYDHFDTRAGLLIALYRMIDLERVRAFEDNMRAHSHTRAQTAALLSAAFIDCAADTKGEFHAVGSALAGSEEKLRVLEELFDNCVRMFVEVLKEHSSSTIGELERRCVGLVGAGEALSAAIVRKQLTKIDAIDALNVLIEAALRA